MVLPLEGVSSVAVILRFYRWRDALPTEGLQLCLPSLGAGHGGCGGWPPAPAAAAGQGGGWLAGLGQGKGASRASMEPPSCPAAAAGASGQPHHPGGAPLPHWPGGGHWSRCPVQEIV